MVGSGAASSASRNGREMVRHDPRRTRSLCGEATRGRTPLPAAATRPRRQPGPPHARRGPVPARCHQGPGLLLLPWPPGHLLRARSICGTFRSLSPAFPSATPRCARHPAGFIVKSEETHFLFRVFIGLWTSTEFLNELIHGLETLIKNRCILASWEHTLSKVTT